MTGMVDARTSARTGPTAEAPAPAPVLCADLDGTLLSTDLLWESVMALLRRKPWKALLLPVWFIRGRANLKQHLSREVSLDPATLPYRQEVVAFVQQEGENGRPIVVATAADRRVAEAVVAHLGLDAALLASDGQVNMAGWRKRKALEAFLNGAAFDYIGNSRADLAVWAGAAGVIVADASAGVLREAGRLGKDVRVLSRRESRLWALLRALRVTQWVKNILLFVPLITSHKVVDPRLLLPALVAFASFSLTASAVYIVNDLLDLESDRHHPRKRLRPFAAGSLPISTGVLLVPFLLLGAFALAATFTPPLFVLSLALYAATATAYSLYLKRLAAMDILVLAGLYTLRVLAGGLAVGVPISEWLLAFSIFVFLSLACVKRSSELELVRANGEREAKGRGYDVRDAELIRLIGVTSAYLSVLVLALYISSVQVAILYRRPGVLWLVCPLLLYWLTRVWFLTHRGAMHDDPVVFALRDPTSYVVGALVGAAVLAAI